MLKACVLVGLLIVRLLNFSAPASIKIYLLVAVSMQNKLLCWETIGIDLTLQATLYPPQYEKQNSHKLFKRKV